MNTYNCSQVYNSFSQLILPPGGENYFSLFYRNLSNIFEYCKNFDIIINSEFKKLLENRLENIEDFYKSRIETDEKFILSTDNLYLNYNNISNAIKKFKVIKLNEYKLEKSSNFPIKKFLIYHL